MYRTEVFTINLLSPKLWEGNVFTGVCQSVHGDGCLWYQVLSGGGVLGGGVYLGCRVYLQFLGTFGKIVCWRSPLPPGSWCPHLLEILYPPLIPDTKQKNDHDVRYHKSLDFQNEKIFVQLDELDKLDRITHE